jgi:hypothetical protein
MSLDVVRTIEIFEFLRSQATIDKSKIQEWKESRDENVLGLLLHAVSHEWGRIQPGLSRADYGDLVLSVFIAGVEGKAEKKTSYAQSPYEAGYSLATWALQAISHVSTEPQILAVLHRAKEVLAPLYRSGDEPQRRTIVDGVLEHLFESSEIRQVFANWQSQPDLLPAFEQAEKWGVYVLRKRSLLRRVAEITTQRLISQGTKVRDVKTTEVGTDTVVLEFDEPTESRRELVIDCEDELISFVEGLNADAAPKFIEILASYAADPAHWSPGEHIASQLWVNIPRSAR